MTVVSGHGVLCWPSGWPAFSPLLVPSGFSADFRRTLIGPSADSRRTLGRPSALGGSLWALHWHLIVIGLGHRFLMVFRVRFLWSVFFLKVEDAIINIVI